MPTIGVKEVNIGDIIKVYNMKDDFKILQVGDIVEIEEFYSYLKPENGGQNIKTGYLIGYDKRKNFMPNTVDPDQVVVVLSENHPKFMTNISHDYFSDCNKVPAYAIKSVSKVQRYDGSVGHDEHL